MFIFNIISCIQDFCIKVPVLKVPPGGVYSCSQSDQTVEPIEEIEDFTPWWDEEEEEEEGEEDNSSNETEVESDQSGFDLYSK